jgi:hypothetical protein
VHFARVVVIDNKYIQVLTEFDGDPMQYTEFFRRELGPVFQAVSRWSMARRAGMSSTSRTRSSRSPHDLNLKSLGTSENGNGDRGYLFSAFGDATVRDLKAGRA